MFFGFDLTQAIEVLGYPGIFAIVLAESGLFFGVSLPGGSLLFTSGLLASQGLLNIWILMMVILVAAILGDSIGYWFGSWVGPALWRRPDGRFFKKAYLIQTRDFFEKHGTRTILLARFIPVVRTFAPIVAGVAQMHYRTFFFYNVLGAIVWGGGYTIAGYLLGEHVPGIENYLEWIVLGIIVVTAIPFLWHVRAAQRASRTTEGKGRTFPSALLSHVKGSAFPRAIVFDLDDTLADSFTPPTEAMLERLVALSANVPVAILSAAAYERVESDVLSRLRPSKDASFHVFTDSSARCVKWDGTEWKETFVFPLTDNEQRMIESAIKDAVEEAGTFAGEEDTTRILVRETSVAFTAARPGASQDEKRAWDPDFKKRRRLLANLQEKLPLYEVLIGGKTTIDVTKKGITKKHGVEWLAKKLAIPASTMLFVGDGFYEGGNDAVVIPTGIETRQTEGPEETARIIDDLITATR